MFLHFKRRRIPLNLLTGMAEKFFYALVGAIINAIRMQGGASG